MAIHSDRFVDIRHEAVRSRHMNTRRRAMGIWLSLANAFISAPTLMLSAQYNATRILAIVSFVIFGVLVFRRINNIYFLARTLTLGFIGYYPMLIKVIAGPGALFSLYEHRTQDFDIVAVMYVATSLALLGNEVGLSLGSRNAEAAATVPLPNESGLWRTVFYVTGPLILIVSVLTIRAVGPTVFTAAYGSQSEAQLLGNTQNIGIICLLAAFVALHKARIKHGRTVFGFLAVTLLGWAMLLRGIRQDVITAILGLAVCYGLVNRSEYRLSLTNIGLFTLAVVGTELMGVARGMLAIQGVTMSQVWQTFKSTLFAVDGVHHLGTVSPIATTFANAVYLVDTDTMGLVFGRSFLEFIPRTLPEFVYPGRPRDYAWMFGDYGLGAGGGIFELAEAYMNFGLVGTLIVPGIISYLMARAFVNSLNRQTAFGYFLLFAFLGVFLRGTWYQIFAFYKSFWTAIVLFGGISVLHSVLAPSTRRYPSALRPEWAPRAFQGGVPTSRPSR